MNSPAETRTKSPAQSFELGFSRFHRWQADDLQPVSERALRNVSACALPRPSAIASAKFANSTVNHSHNVIWRLKAELRFGSAEQQKRGDHAADLHHEHDGISHHCAGVQP